MNIHEQVLEAARRLASGQSDWTFKVDEVVRSLGHLNQSSIRTHVGSRCCVNAPKNHPHKWDYFRRVDRGKYQVLPKYRRAARDAAVVNPLPPNRFGASVAARLPSSRRETIHAVVHKDGAVYVAECLELAVVTQGGTHDEVVGNLEQAVALHLDGEDREELGLAERVRLQLAYDAPLAL